MKTSRAGRGRLARSALALLTVLGSAFGPAGCSLRDRSNPLDPKNSVTRGLLIGFNAIAGDGVVELRWPLLTQQGVVGYRIDRWLPGETPHALPGAAYPPYVGAGEDASVHNDTTYVYRLIARFASGDSAVSPPDTTTPGTRRPMVLVAELPGVVGLAPDVRDVLYANLAAEAYDDIELDRARGVFWLSQYDRGLIVRRRFEGATVGVELYANHPSDLAVTTGLRGIGWAALPADQKVEPYGLPDTNSTEPGLPIVNVGPARIVEANSKNATVWIGADDGGLHHARASTSEVYESWQFANRINSIAVDEANDVAWVATRSGDLCELYRVVGGNPDPELFRTGLLNVTDLEFEPDSRSLWISERGAALRGNGRLTRIGPAGETLATVTGIEPYALAVEAGSRSCWVTDIASDRLIEVSSTGTILKRSPPLGVPYGVRVHRP